jgi:hypothetical protein
VKVSLSRIGVDLVMQEAARREKNEVVKKVGSASTSGRRERERFKIPEKGVEVDAMQLIGPGWFDVDGLDGEQRESKASLYVIDGSV